MSAVVISDNTTIKISSAVSATSSSAGTVYTCPASSYAIVQVGIKDTAGAGTTVTITVDSKEIHQSAVSATTTRILQGIYLGPSQTLAFTGANVTVTVTGVAFINSP